MILLNNKETIKIRKKYAKLNFPMPLLQQTALSCKAQTLVSADVIFF
jgi:hypothetical protein